ncbi:MAG TPA: NrfD/PsrC family molybdoenzyme membrane anchor subunit [Bacteroidales bacterium]|nr:NrfD/PsrC family molybdoenzyme membrane anchor subunit [Bacteroidales bacterium]
MNEQLIISGRLNEYIDPTLTIWPWPIPLYLFVGGMAAGILIFCGLSFLQGKSNRFEAAVFKAPLIVPILLVVGLAALFYDLSHKLYFWRLYTSFRIEAPMSWGAWVLMVVTPVSIAWVAITNRQYLLFILEKFPWLLKVEDFLNKNRKSLAWMMIVFGILLGIYTGILLSAFNARPLWNTSILAILFLVSGLSTGAAAITLFSKSHEERHYFAKIDLGLIGVELFLIVHMFMGLLAGVQVQIDAARLFLGGPYTFGFWFFVVALGLLVPAVLNVMELKGRKIPHYIAPVLVIIGGLLLRFIIVHAGQISSWM